MSVPENERKMYRMVFDDYATDGMMESRAAVEASLLMLGVEAEQIQLRLARFLSGKTLAALDYVDFESWLELATVEITKE